MNTLTLQQAIELAPAIGADSPSPRVSSKYHYISTRDILDQALSSGWSITQVKQERGKEFGRHSVSLVPTSLLNETHPEGYPQVIMSNSHDKTKRFQMMMGFFRLVCSNGLIAPTGAVEGIRLIHRFSDDRQSILTESLKNSLDCFPLMYNKVAQFQDRDLTNEEKLDLANYSQKVRFRYRHVPKSHSTEGLLVPCREIDKGDDLWRTFNTIQENMMKGGRGLGNGITRFYDDIRINRGLWEGAEQALVHRGADLKEALNKQIAAIKKIKSGPRK